MFIIILMSVYAWKTYWRTQDSGYSLFGFKSWVPLFDTVKQVPGALFPHMKLTARPDRLSQAPLEDSVRWCSSPTSGSSIQVSAPFLLFSLPYFSCAPLQNWLGRDMHLSFGPVCTDLTCDTVPTGSSCSIIERGRVSVSARKWKWKSLGRVRLSVTPWTIQSMEFSRPE